MTTPHKPSRGPSDLEIAIDENKRCTLAALEHEAKTERILRELHESQDRVRDLGLEPLRPTFGRPMNAADQVSRGIAFWDRDPVDAAPDRRQLEAAS